DVKAAGRRSEPITVTRRIERDRVLTVVIRRLGVVGDRNNRVIDRIMRLQADFFGYRHAEAQRRAVGRRAVVRITPSVALLHEQVEPAGHALIEEIGFGETEVHAARTLPFVDREPNGLATAHEVAVGNRDLADEAFRRRVAAGDVEAASGLLLDLDVDHDAIRGGPRLVGDLDLLEVAETVEVALGAVDEHAIVRIAFADFELAADHIFAGLVVAVNI